jgi:predicted amidohydrolase
MMVILCNGVGVCDDFVAMGNLAVWDAQGNLIGQLDGETEGLMFVDLLLNLGRYSFCHDSIRHLVALFLHHD